MPSYAVKLNLKHGDDRSEAYRELAGELDRLNGFRVRSSEWMVDVWQSAEQLQSHLSTPFYLRPGDVLAVEELTRNHRYCMLTGMAAEWIRAHPPLR